MPCAAKKLDGAGGDMAAPEEATDNSWTQLMALFLLLVSQNQSVPLIVSYDPS